MLRFSSVKTATAWLYAACKLILGDNLSPALTAATTTVSATRGAIIQWGEVTSFDTSIFEPISLSGNRHLLLDMSFLLQKTGFELTRVSVRMVMSFWRTIYSRPYS